MKINQSNGISLVILLITMVVIVILSGSAIFIFVNNNPIEQANKVIYLSDLKNFQDELESYKSNLSLDIFSGYNPSSLQADDNSVTYNGIVDTSKNIVDLVPSIEESHYHGEFKIVDGKIVVSANDTTKQDWAEEAGIEAVSVFGPIVNISSPDNSKVVSGTDVVYTINFTSNVAIETIDLIDKIEVLDNDDVPLSVQPIITIGIISGTSVDTTRQVDITIATDTLANASYKLKIKVGVVKDANNISNTEDIISLNKFNIDNIAPENPIILANLTEWTNGNVIIKITYSKDSAKKQYSLDGINWNNYTSEIIVKSNNTNIYARGTDNVGNQTTQAILTVTNIDKIVPVITVSNGGTTSSSITVNAEASDIGESGLNESSYQYSKDNGVTWTASTSETSYTFDALSTGTYQCKAKVSDNASNISTSSVVEISTTVLGNITLAASTIVLTNENVAVTVTYPIETVTKQYSIDGETWYAYTVPVDVAVNNTTVYAKGLDAVGNQTTQATLTVTNIDKDVPVIIVSNGVTTSSSITVNAEASDIGGSEVNELSYQYSKDNGVTWTASTSETSYTFDAVSTGTYQCKVKVSDNASNISTSSAVAISTTVLGNITLAATPTDWTNGNVAVTVTYPAEAVTKQYSTNGETWYAYTVPVDVAVNNTTVYAKGLDVVGNQITQATLTVINIDKIVPTILYGTDGGVVVNLASTKLTVSDIGGSLLNNSTLQYKWDTQNITMPVSGWTTFTNGATITYNTLGTYYLWVKVVDNAGNILVTKSNSFRVLAYALANTPVTEPASIISTLTVNSTINGSPPVYSNPIIPAGFGVVNTPNASWSNVASDWNKGLVIQDIVGNQFVWVPVNGTNVTYVKWCTQGIAYNNGNISNNTLPSGVTSETYQIIKYGGFYIARCEAGLEGANTAVSKKNAAVWTRMNYTTAKFAAESMYNNTVLCSGLVTGTQWDTVMKWVQNSGKNITNSRTWGNYKNSSYPANVKGYASLQISGFTEFWKANNIYGLAGNILEWSNELYTSSSAVVRGGFYSDNGNKVGSSNRGYNSFSYVNSRSGFRCVLYLK